MDGEVTEVQSHFGVIYFSGDPTNDHPDAELRGKEPTLKIIACGPEEFCWASLIHYTVIHQLRDGESAEVLMRDPRLMPR